MQFEHPHQHSLSNLERFEEKLRREKLSAREALFLADTLVGQGHPMALRPLNVLKTQVRHSDVQKFVKQQEDCYRLIRNFFRFEELDETALEMFYRLHGLTYVKSKAGTSKLLVVFTTMFNNFAYSNAVMAAFLSQLNCDLLFLRDTSRFNYLKGAEGIADDFPGVGNRILELARLNGIEEIYITAYSSGGYAALLTSLRIPCRGFLGFSHAMDLRPDSPLKTPLFFTPEIAAQIDPAWLQDLKDPLERADPAVPRALYYGERSSFDASHGRHAAQIAGIRAIALPNVRHNTVVSLFLRGRLLALFARLISGRSDWPAPQMKYPDPPHRS